MSSGPRFGMVVEYVKDVQAARRFYVEVMGLRAEREHPTYVQFEHYAITSDAALAGSGEPETYWLVDDVEAAFRALSEGTEIVLPLTTKPFGTMFGIRNADGRPAYLLQFAANRPSTAVE
ncbi:VOC family protein [Longimicrobium sp.]|uniref:VOC family protein n=1 Tax=Longimicrobium sp. TaxID=2029185 RepID=UPI002E2EE5FA|nr:VOC family protein [Longimicrobium sp.]HEX6039069.1 VOC family protein [Longimicrobium sp.]